jgi:hypothetical protein
MSTTKKDLKKQQEALKNLKKAAAEILNPHIVYNPFTYKSPAKQSKQRIQRVPWTPYENELLEQGISMYGNNWQMIAERFFKNDNGTFSRTNVQVKDRARTIGRAKN